MDVDIPPITINEVEVAVKKLTNRKSPGIDQISGEVLKAGGVKMAEMLLFQLSGLKCWLHPYIKRETDLILGTTEQ